MIVAEEAIGPERWHGTTGGTSNHQCKCLACRTVWREYIRAHRAKLKSRIDPNDSRHGTASFYQNHGCRCTPCTTASTDQRRQWAKP